MTNIIKAKRKKNASAVLSYGFDWSNWLALDETISSYTITCDDPALTISTKSKTGNIVRWVLSGGVPGEVYYVRVTIVTSDAQTDYRDFRVHIEEN